MPKYENGVIYKLKHNLDYDDLNIYIGSTTNFKNRKNQHKTACNNEKSRNYNSSIYKFIRDNGGWVEWVMIPIEVYSCDSKKELEIRERHHIDLLRPTLNKNIPTRTDKEYYEDNKEKILEKIKEYKEANKEKIAERMKEYYEANKEKILEKEKERYENNKEKKLEKHKEWYENNKEKKLEKVKEYYEANKEQRKEYNKEHYENNKQKYNEKHKEWYENNKQKYNEKVICDKCGCESTKSHLKRHQKTKKCINS
jgi:hypothetical protein